MKGERRERENKGIIYFSQQGTVYINLHPQECNCTHIRLVLISGPFARCYKIVFIKIQMWRVKIERDSIDSAYNMKDVGS